MYFRMRSATLYAVAMISVVLVFSACQGPSKPRIPKSDKLVFSGKGEGWPPQPKGVSNIAEVPSQDIPSLSDELETEIRTLVLADSRVQKAVGERYSYIGIERVDDPKDVQEIITSTSRIPLDVRAVMYSYSNNAAVEAFVRRGTIERVETLQGYQPPEGLEEIERAVALARKEPGLSVRTEALLGEAPLMESIEGPGQGHRLFYVTFSKENAEEPSFWAVIDLNDEKVLASGPSTKLTN